MCHTFLVTVKKCLKSVYYCRSYRKIKTGISLFWNTLYVGSLKLQDWTLQDWTPKDEAVRVDIAGLDNDGPDNA